MTTHSTPPTPSLATPPAASELEPTALEGFGPEESPATLWWHVLLIATVTFVAHYLLAHRFGLYEDDYFGTGVATRWQFSDFVAWIKTCWRDQPHGRPVGWIVLRLIPFVAFKIGGLYAVYLAGYLVVAANAVLFYLLLRRCLPRPIPLLAGLAFVLFPADTTRAMQIHAHHLQPAVLYTLIAAHASLSASDAWQARRYRRYAGLAVLICVLAAMAFLSYESAVLPLLLVPLLKGRWKWSRRYEWLLHWGMLGLVLGGLVLVRMLRGENQLSAATGEMGSLPTKLLKSLYMGPETSMGQYLHRPGLALHILTHHGQGPLYSHKALAVTVTLATFALMTWLFVRRAATVAGSFADRMKRANAQWGLVAKPLVVGVLMLVTAYLLSFTHFPPTATEGRMTSVHLAASFGGAILSGTAAALVLSLATLFRVRILAGAGVAVSLALLMAFSLMVQFCLARSADDQRHLWTNIVRLCPDMNEGTMILVDGIVWPYSGFALTSSWADGMVLPTILDFRSSKRPPVVAIEQPQGPWRALLAWKDDRLIWSRPPFPPFSGLTGGPIPEPGNVILLQYDYGKVTRPGLPLEIDGRPFPVKPIPPAGATLRYGKGALYDLLIDESRLRDPQP